MFNPENHCQYPSVWIVILNWNGWRDTLACLGSLDRLDYPNFQVVVVDNASEDDSVEQIRKVRSDLELIESDRNRGFSGGCNLGIRMALKRKADYVWLLNNDTLVDPHALTAMVEMAESDGRIGAVGSVLYHLDDVQKIQAWGGGWVGFLTGTMGEYSRRVEDKKLTYLSAASMLIPRFSVERIGLFDEILFFMYWEDADFSYRLQQAGLTLRVAEYSRVFHRVGGATSKHVCRRDCYINASAVRFFRKHHQFPIIPIIVGTTGKFIKRIMTLDFLRAGCLLKGIYQGVTQKGSWSS